MKIAGLEVVDVSSPIHLHILAIDIVDADKQNPATCAAARACCRQLKAEAALVHLGRTYVRKGNKWRRYFTPESLRRELIAFDRGGAFMPGDFKLSPLSPSHQGTGRRQGGYTIAKPGEKKHIRYVPEIRHTMKRTRDDGKETIDQYSLARPGSRAYK
jgi:hypothetical protein